MRYVETPENLPEPLRSWSRAPVAFRTGTRIATVDGPIVFLAGGITGCPDWQADAAAMLADTNLVLCNPRRPEFDTADPAAADEQILWEVAHLRRADLTLFWFPPSGDVPQPIALFELGMALGDRKCWGRKIVIGVDPDYCRRRDVIAQCRCAAPAMPVHDRLDQVCAAALTELA